MKNIFEQLTDLLKKDERLVSQDGVLLKNQTQELARKNDPELIKLLLSDKAIKQHFFFEVEKTLIFDKENFIRFVSNKQFLPDSYTAFKNKIGLTAGDEYVSENKEVVLAWPYKDCVLEGGMTKEDQKRDEIFYNETLAPDDINRLLDAKVFTNFKRIDKKGEHKLDGFNRDEKNTIKDNLIIKGNNLLALASLKKEFAGKVKLIYIDPPYNTGNDGFKYNDSFNHSSWLVFMKNRLEFAKTLLKDDGFIFVQCDDSEQAYLKVLLDDIFRRDNFVSTLVRKIIEGGKQDSKFIQNIHDYIFIYSKNIKAAELYRKKQEDFEHYNKKDEYFEARGFYYLKPLFTKGLGYVKSLDYPINYGGKDIYPNIGNKKEYRWVWSKDRVVKALKNGFIEFIENKKSEIKVYYKTYQFVTTENKELERSNPYTSLMVDGFGNRQSQIESTNIFGSKLFDFPKPEKLLMEIVNMSTKNNDIVLDFFAGSGTTLAVAHKMERQYIGIEQMDYIHELPESRLKKVIAGEQGGISRAVNWQGGGDFVYMELAKWNEEWIEKIEKAKTSKEIARFWDEMKEGAFLSYKVDPKTIDTNAKDFADLDIADQKKFLIECLDKNQLYINLSEIEDKEYGVSKEDKDLNKNFYGM